MSVERKSNITIVSGYWPVHNKYTPQTYYKWFENTLKINQRMYFFGDSSIKETILPYRKNMETIFVDHPISKFFSNNFYLSKSNSIIEEKIPDELVTFYTTYLLFVKNYGSDIPEKSKRVLGNALSSAWLKVSNVMYLTSLP